MAKSLIISGHPDYKHSFANRAILDEVHRLKPHVEIVYLDALYPDYRMDAPTEQKRLVGADIIVFEFPMWWYSSPSLLHAYVEQVFTHGFAYGSQGVALRGKEVVWSFTTGAPEAAYNGSGKEGYAIEAFMPPFYATAQLTGLRHRGNVISYGMALVPDTKELRDEILARAIAHAERLASLLD